MVALFRDPASNSYRCKIAEFARGLSVDRFRDRGNSHSEVMKSSSSYADFQDWHLNKAVFLSLSGILSHSAVHYRQTFARENPPTSSRLTQTESILPVVNSAYTLLSLFAHTQADGGASSRQSRTSLSSTHTHWSQFRGTAFLRSYNRTGLTYAQIHVALRRTTKRAASV